MSNNYDVIIAGTGVGGLYSALNLPSELRVLLITKRELILCNSALAQGGVAAVYKPVDDSIQLHTNDTLIAGGFKNNPDSLKVLVTEAAKEIERIISLGVDFDKDENGNLHRTLEDGIPAAEFFITRIPQALRLQPSCRMQLRPCLTLPFLKMLCYVTSKKLQQAFQRI